MITITVFCLSLSSQDFAVVQDGPEDLKIGHLQAVFVRVYLHCFVAFTINFYIF